MDATYYINKLMEYYQVYTISDLAEKIKIGQPSISKWKINNSLNAIKKKCRELGIYNEIFNDIKNINQSNANISGIGAAGVEFGTKTINQNKTSALQIVEDLDDFTKQLLFTFLTKYKDEPTQLQKKLFDLINPNA